MITHTGEFQTRVLRDAMHIAAQCSDRARMKIDATGIHIRAKDATLTTMAWIDIPRTVFRKDYLPEDPIFKDDIGINSEKLHRILNAYEPAAPIEFCLESREGVGELTTITGTEGTLWTYQTSLDHIGRIPLLDGIQASHPPAVSGAEAAEYFREWLQRIEDNEIAVSFRYEKESGRFPIKTVSEHTEPPEVLVLSYPEAPEDADSLRTLVSLELLQNAIAPQCIDDDLKFSFGDDTPLYISTQTNGCDVAMAIAPRIEAGEEP